MCNIGEPCSRGGRSVQNGRLEASRALLGAMYGPRWAPSWGRPGGLQQFIGWAPGSGEKLIDFRVAGDPRRLRGGLQGVFFFGHAAWGPKKQERSIIKENSCQHFILAPRSPPRASFWVEYGTTLASNLYKKYAVVLSDLGLRSACWLVDG